MNTKKDIALILRRNNTVFTALECAIIWGESSQANLNAALRYYVRTGQLHRIRRGIYAKDKNYDHLELANKMLTPSYVSFETVLLRSGMIFQYYGSVFSASYTSRAINVEGARYAYRRIVKRILTRPEGLTVINGATVATPERAFLDMLYLHRKYYFDNLRPLNWELIKDLLPIYQNKRLEREVRRQYKQYAVQRGVA